MDDEINNDHWRRPDMNIKIIKYPQTCASPMARSMTSMAFFNIETFSSTTDDDKLFSASIVFIEFNKLFRIWWCSNLSVSRPWITVFVLEIISSWDKGVILPISSILFLGKEILQKNAIYLYGANCRFNSSYALNHDLDNFVLCIKGSFLGSFLSLFT